jgi:hypothetical protein
VSAKTLSGRCLAVFVILAAIGQLLLGQEAKDTKFRGRLPAHYGDIVSEAQRLQIYAVQEKYARQIDELKLKLELLESQRDREIENVLSAEQKARLKKVQDQAAAQRRKKSADAKAAEEGKVSVPTAAKTAKK